jgi:glycine/serine hydroxymethyltransferase
VTTRGLGVAEMRQIAELIETVLAAPADEGVRARVRERVRAMAKAFPLYPGAVAAPGDRR